MTKNKTQDKTTHVSDRKKTVVKDLAGLLKKRTIMVVSVKNLPSSQFQEIRKKLRGMAELKVAKKSLVDFALEHAGNKELKELINHVESNSAILFSDQDAFELSGFLAENKSPAKAKAGQVSDQNITIEAGPTELLPGPAITELSAVGLRVKVEGGKIAIQQSLVLIKNGEVISEAKAGILSKLNMAPFKIGLEPVAAYLDGKIYVGIKIDKPAALVTLRDAFARAFAFAVSTDYISEDTVGQLITKAGREELSLSKVLNQPEQAQN